MSDLDKRSPQYEWIWDLGCLAKKCRGIQSIPRSHLKSYLLSIRDQGEHPPRITSHLLDCKKDKLRIGHSQNYFSFHFFKHRDFS